MDRTSGTYADGDDSAVSCDMIGEVPVRSSSAPPDPSLRLSTLEEVSGPAAGEANTQALLTLSQSSESIEPCTSHNSLRVSPTTNEKHLKSYFTSQLGHRPETGDPNSTSIKTWSYGNRTQNMPILTIPVTPNPPRSSSPIFDHRFLSFVFPNATQEYPVPVCSLSAGDGQVGHAQPQSYFKESLVALPKGMLSHNLTRDEGQDLRSQGIAARVKALDLSSTPAMHTFFTHGVLPHSGSGSMTSATGAQSWLDAGSDPGFRPDGLWHMPYPGMAPANPGNESLAPPFGSGIARNPMWGFAEYQVSADMGHDWRDLQSPMTHGSESLTNTSGSSSLASSRSLPDLTWTSNDPWPSRSGAKWLEDNPDPSEERSTKRQAGLGSERVDLGQPLSASWTPNTETSNRAQANSQTLNMDWQSSSVPGAGSSIITVGRIAGGRIEEGSIGSKKRIWYRAPNGQFASATQALSGNFPGEGSGGSGQDSLHGNSEGFRRIRRRRKSEEVERKYRCDYDGCDKAYGTLNHLNTHRATNDHGPRLNAVGGYHSMKASLPAKVKVLTRSLLSSLCLF
ncbi:hypothetical protein NDA10_000141 [Ustilago hordei]|nr:hypothetical protein NDA10_000141 [Ustilago hordei]